jgi:hypothetical protein
VGDHEISGVDPGRAAFSAVNELAKALDAREARASLPNLPVLEVSLQSVEFAAQGPELLVRRDRAD